MEVFFSDLAEFKLKKLKDYLLEEWSNKVKEDFLLKLELKLIKYLLSLQAVRNLLDLMEFTKA